MFQRIAFAGAILAGSLANPSTAATLISLDRAGFVAASSGLTVQDFDTLSSGSTLFNDGFITYSTTGGDPLVTSSFLTSTNPNGLGATNIGFFGPLDTLTLSFASPIGAFGIDINTFATGGGAYRAVLNTGDDAFSIFETFPGTGTGQFLGFVSDTPFTSLTLSAGSGFPYTVDTIRYGERAAFGAVPEPSTWLLLLLGFFTIGAGIRRTKSTRTVTVSYS